VQVPYDGNEPLYRAMSPYDRIGVDARVLRRPGRNDTLVDVQVAAISSRSSGHRQRAMYYVELPFTQHAFDISASPRTSATTRAAVAFAESCDAPRLTASLVKSYQVPPTELVVRVSTASGWSA